MENYYLYVKKSDIENIGEGVFAKCDIPENTIICEYEGNYIDKDHYYILGEEEQNRALTFNDGYIIGDNVASKINDIIDFRPYSLEEWNDCNTKCKFILHPNKQYNCKFKTHERGISLITTRNVSKEDELYLFYGFAYWVQRLYLKKYLPIKLQQFNTSGTDL